MDNADKALEARINEIEKRLNMFQTMVMREKVREEGLPRYIENQNQINRKIDIIRFCKNVILVELFILLENSILVITLFVGRLNN